MLSVEVSPRFRTVPPADFSQAASAAQLSSGYGLIPDGWQFDVLDGWLGVLGSGRLASPRCGLALARQNGKNGVLEMAELFKMVGLGRRVLHTAHEVKTARKAFLRLLGFFDNPRQFPELAELVKTIRRTNGQEAVELWNGGSVEFIARSSGSGRGFSVDDLVMDEAQDLTEEQLAALLPTISAAPDPQQIMTGTPPGPKAPGEVFWRVRTEGSQGSPARLSWVEYGCPDDVDLDDEVEWYRANPALGIRLSLDTVRDERAAMADDTFARERLGVWGGSKRANVVDAATWAARVDERSRPAARFALAVDVAPDRSVSSVGFAGQRPDGGWHVELDEQRHGVGWLAAHVAERCRRNDIRAVVIDAQSQAASLVEDLALRKIKVTLTQTRDMAQACGLFYDGSMDGWLHHIDQPQLNFALGVARKRPLLSGDAWAWNRKNPDSDITPLVACTLALWGAQSSNVKKPARAPGAPSRRATVL